MNFASRIVSQACDVAADTVYEFAHRVENLPRWAARANPRRAVIARPAANPSVRVEPSGGSNPVLIDSPKCERREESDKFSQEK